MSPSVRFSRYAKQAADLAIRRAHAQLSPAEQPAFVELLHAVHTRSSARVCPQFASVLLNVARFASRYLRPVAEWPGAEGSMYPVVHALVQHLLARHPVPRFLASVWYGDASAAADARRGWFIAHAAGSRFRELPLPLPMTRQMEALFLRSPDHLSVAAALRRAELLSLGAKDELVSAVLATRLGWDLANGAFWRTVMEFFVRRWAELAPGAVGPIVDFLQAVRHAPTEVLGDEGVRWVGPPEPGFSIKGRSVASLQRLVEAWHRSLGRVAVRALSWPRSGLRPLTFEDPAIEDRPAVRWQLVELTSSAELQREGAALRHCVASYTHRCVRGLSRIWSLRRSCVSSRSVATIELDPRARAIVQARGVRNQAPSRRARALIQLWARRENLCVRI